MKKIDSPTVLGRKLTLTQALIQLKNAMMNNPERGTDYKIDSSVKYFFDSKDLEAQPQRNFEAEIFQIPDNFSRDKEKVHWSVQGSLYWNNNGMRLFEGYLIEAIIQAAKVIKKTNIDSTEMLLLPLLNKYKGSECNLLIKKNLMLCWQVTLIDKSFVRRLCPGDYLLYVDF